MVTIVEAATEEKNNCSFGSGQICLSAYRPFVSGIKITTISQSSNTKVNTPEKQILLKSSGRVVHQNFAGSDQRLRTSGQDREPADWFDYKALQPWRSLRSNVNDDDNVEEENDEEEEEEEEE
ncbi:hypothetical protein WH47_02302 [Habropoda laboriosa]|uniref:Uncharacterized protein n=1 Tax=Habropoda laboriosa TaxID=597456 RepID=A0A0L7QY57_9HYME|nr:hypothetical protein WH47_02302 [Habropoda laboriosa]